MATAKKYSRRAPRTGPRIWPRIVLALGVLMLVLALFYRDTMIDRALTGTAYGARVACSCHFIAGRSLDDCRKDFEPGMGLVSLSADMDAASVTASVPLLASQTATYLEGYGCVLERWHD